MIIKQNILKWKYYKLRTFLLVLLFTVLFSAFLIFVVLYDNAKENFSYMNRYTMNQLTLSARSFFVGSYILDELEEDPDVYDYNVLDHALSAGEMFVDITPVIEDRPAYEQYVEDRKKRLQEMEMEYVEPLDGCIYGVRDSETCTYFLTQGFKLIKGRHITDADSDSNAALVSEELAQQNGLEIGDTFKVGPEDDFRYSSEKEYTLEVAGVFHAPAGQSYVRLYEDPKNFVFMHYKPFGNEFYHKYADGMPGVAGINIFLKDHASAEEFIKRFDEAHNAMAGEYRFYTNKEWADILSGPLKEMKNFSRALVIIFLVGICMILLILSAFLIEKERNDIRILFALGEKRKSIICSVMIGQVVPILVGGVLAIGVAAGFSRAVGDAISDTYYENSQAFAEEMIAENVELYDDGKVSMSAPERMTMNVEMRVEFAMMARTMIVYLALLFTGVPVLVFLQCRLRIRRN